MSNTPIAATAGAARQRLASSLSTLQQDPSVPAAVLNIVQGLARAMGPLFQVERGSGDPALLFQARAVLQETLGQMQTVDQAYPGVGDATAAIAQSLGMLFAAIKEHGIVDPGPARAAAPPTPPPVAHQPPPVAHQPPPTPQPQAAAIPLTQPAAQPMLLTQPAAQPIPLTQHAAQHPAPHHPPAARGPAPSTSRGADPVHKTVFPETAAKVPVGPHGLPRVEAEVEAFSDTNFYTNFVGDIRDHGGIFVATYAVLAIGTACEVALKFPGEYQVEFRGVVRWRRDASAESTSAPGMGIEISQASDDAWALIDRFIKKREPIIQEV